MAFKGVGKRLKWIPVSMVLPDTEVIACDKQGNVMVGFITYNRGKFICERDYRVLNDTVAWAQLP